MNRYVLDETVYLSTIFAAVAQLPCRQVDQFAVCMFKFPKLFVSEGIIHRRPSVSWITAVCDASHRHATGTEPRCLCQRGLYMPKDDPDVLALLKSELEFLEKGGYAKPSSRQQCIFQDSPTCLNYGRLEDRRPCSECVLFGLVPLDRRKEKIPCRHIPLNEQGETLDSLYHRRTQEVIETAVSRWLRVTIQELEREQAQNQSHPPGTSARTKVVSKPPLNHANLGREATRFPKCANPECSASFHYKEGQLFRLHLSHKDGEPPPNTHSVQHFWLCNTCSESYTLEYEGDRGLIFTHSRELKELHFVAPV